MQHFPDGAPAKEVNHIKANKTSAEVKVEGTEFTIIQGDTEAETNESQESNELEESVQISHSLITGAEDDASKNQESEIGVNGVKSPMKDSVEATSSESGVLSKRLLVQIEDLGESYPIGEDFLTPKRPKVQSEKELNKDSTVEHVSVTEVTRGNLPLENETVRVTTDGEKQDLKQEPPTGDVLVTEDTDTKPLVGGNTDGQNDDKSSREDSTGSDHIETKGDDNQSETERDMAGGKMGLTYSVNVKTDTNIQDLKEDSPAGDMLVTEETGKTLPLVSENTDGQKDDKSSHEDSLRVDHIEKKRDDNKSETETDGDMDTQLKVEESNENESVHRQSVRDKIELAIQSKLQSRAGKRNTQTSSLQHKAQRKKTNVLPRAPRGFGYKCMPNLRGRFTPQEIRKNKELAERNRKMLETLKERKQVKEVKGNQLDESEKSMKEEPADPLPTGDEGTLVTGTLAEQMISEIVKNRQEISQGEIELQAIYNSEERHEGNLDILADLAIKGEDTRM